MEIQIQKALENVSSNICYMSKDLFKLFKLSKKVLYKFHLGQSNEYSYIIPAEERDNCMYFSSSVFNSLMLFEGITLNMRKNEDEIFLGPVVAIFINPRGTDALKDGNPSFCIQKHAEAGCITNCLAYHYSIEGIDWAKKRIKGYTFVRGLKKWIYHWFPMPDVFYDRGVNFTQYEGPYVTYMKQRFRENNVHFINNQRYLDKWEVHECLSKYPELSTYLPKTIIYRNFNDVLSMLKVFNFIFIKATSGTQGTDVLSIEEIDSGYKLNFFEDGLKEVILEEIDDVKMFVEEYAQGRPYIVQQGIRLLKYTGRNMDLRLLMMKNRLGEWEALEHHCRIAQKNYTITNYSLGGDWIDYDELYPRLSSSFCKIGIPDLEDIMDAAKKILYYYEKEFGAFGELGMDMAVDIYGDIWFIEANTRPDKLSDPSLHAPEEIPGEAMNIFEYAMFLTSNVAD